MAGKGSVNKAIIVGNLGSDPELRNLPDGSSVVNFNVATTDVYYDKNNPSQKNEKTEWHRIVFFGRAAEVIHEYARKGSKIYVEGALQTRKWKDRDENERYTTEIKGREFTFLSSRNDAGGGGGGGDSKPADDNFSDMDNVPF